MIPYCRFLRTARLPGSELIQHWSHQSMLWLHSTSTVCTLSNTFGLPRAAQQGDQTPHRVVSELSLCNHLVRTQSLREMRGTAYFAYRFSRYWQTFINPVLWLLCKECKNVAFTWVDSQAHVIPILEIGISTACARLTICHALTYTISLLSALTSSLATIGVAVQGCNVVERDASGPTTDLT